MRGMYPAYPISCFPEKRPITKSQNREGSEMKFRALQGLALGGLTGHLIRAGLIEGEKIVSSWVKGKSEKKRPARVGTGGKQG